MNLLRKLYISTLVLIISSIILLTNSLSVQATASQEKKSLSMTLVGDSYTAGNGAGSYYGKSGSYQSKQNWGHAYATWLNGQGVKTTVNNLAHSGNTTKEVLENQLPHLPSNTNLVMMTIGGNNANFESVVEKCFATWLRSPNGCRERVDYARSQLPNIIDKTELIFQEISKKLSPSSQIVLVGYPLLSLDTSYVLKRCTKAISYDNLCPSEDTYDAGKAVREAGQLFNKLQKEFVAKWNSKNSMKATFVDTIQSSFKSHEPEPHATGKNPKRWINEFFETEGFAATGEDTDASYSLDRNNWYHPNRIGHHKIALDIINTIGVPSSAKTIAPTTSDTDVAFVIDTTGSMGGLIQQAKDSSTSLAQSLSSMSRSTRFALVDFQDHPGIGGGGYEDYPAKVRLVFSNDLDEFTQSVQGLTLGYGGDWEETVYSGAMAALDLDWRPGVKKILIIIGDAPAKDPEPVTGYTWQQVAQKAYDVDPVEVYAIDVGGGSLNSSIYKLVEQTGGLALLDEGDISTPILSSVSHSLAKPFGWIQGPYVAKVGDAVALDASGSYAVDGEITKIEWDLDGDNIFETTSPDLIYIHTLHEEFGGTIGVKITDTNGQIGYGSTRVDITDDGDTVSYEIDNCPLIANQNQADYDSDGIGDDCDNDIGWQTTDQPGIYAYSIDDIEMTTPEEKATGTASTGRTKDPITPGKPRSNQQPLILAYSGTTYFSSPDSSDIAKNPLDKQIVKSPILDKPAVLAKTTTPVEPTNMATYLLIGIIAICGLVFTIWRAYKRKSN